MKKSRLILSLAFIILFQPLSSAQEQNATVITLNQNSLPVIESLKPARSNAVFAEYEAIVESNRKAAMSGRQREYIFFQYTNTEKFSFMALASRCCIRQETIATLNQIDNAQEDIAGRTLILPTVDGLFIPLDKGINSVEVLLQENYASQTLTKNARWYRIDGRDYVFIPDQKLTGTERFYFLDSALTLPLETGTFWVSSEFGKRKNPFSGEMKSHNGIDLAAEEGTPVFAIKDGAVYSAISGDRTFGNYIILSHDLGKMTSVYAHLSKICVDQYQNVRKGDLIGYVGQTGMATGPHLHFELRQGGKAENPRSKLNFENDD